MFIYTNYIKFNSSTCFERIPPIIRWSTTQIVHMQPLVSSLSGNDDIRDCICTICVVDFLMMGGMRSKHVEELNLMSSSSSYICHGVGPLADPFDLTYPEVSSKVCHDSFCQLGNSVSLPWVIYYGAFYLHVVSNFSCIPVICLKFVLF